MNITRVVLAADSSQIRTAKGDLDNLQKSGEKTQGTITNMGKAIAGLAAAAGIGLSVKQLISYTDRWTDLNSRVLNATGSQEEADKVMMKLAGTARTTYSSIEQTTEAFLKNNLTLRELGYTTEQQVALTDVLNNSLVVSGTKGQTAASVMDALSKAMAFGELRGQNFNTVIQSGGRVVEALADGLGVTTLELRKMAEDGLLKTDVVVTALLSQMEKVNDEAQRMPATIGDGFLLLGDSIFQTVGKMDSLLGVSGSIGGVLVEIADRITGVADGTGEFAGAVDKLVFAGEALTVLLAGRFALSLYASATAIYAQVAAVAVATTTTNVWGQTVVTATAAQNLMTAATTRLTAAFGLLAGPGAVVAVAAGAMYLLVQRQKESANAAWEQALAFDEVIEKLHQMNQNEIARNIQLTHEKIRAYERDLAIQQALHKATGKHSDEIRVLNQQIANEKDNMALLYRQLERVKDKKEELNEVTDTAISNTEFLNNLFGVQATTIDTAAAAYVQLMGVQEETYTRTTRLTAAKKEQIEADLYHSDVLAGVTKELEVMTAATGNQATMSKELAQVTGLMRDDISSAFADMMMNGTNAFDAIAKSFERMIYKMIADWAASGIMNMVGSMFGKEGLGGTSVLGSLFKGIGSKGATDAAVDAATGGTASGGMMAAAGGALKGAGTAILGGAKAVGGAVLGGAQTALAAIGPVGWAVMGAIALNEIFGKKETPTTSSGLLLTDLPGVDSSRKQGMGQFASGIEPVLFQRRSDFGSAMQVAELFRAADAGVMEVFNEAGKPFKLSSGAELQGYSETGQGVGQFFGYSKEKGIQNAPVEDQINQYVRSLISKGLEYTASTSIRGDILSQPTAEGMIYKLQELLGSDGSHFNGLGYVPFDGYRATLHTGEEVNSAANKQREMGLLQGILQELKSMNSSNNGDAVSRFGEYVDRFGSLSSGLEVNA